LADLEAAVLGFPALLGPITDPLLTTDIGEGLPQLNPFEDRADLRFCAPALAQVSRSLLREIGSHPLTGISGVRSGP